jgi:hypothetical protein
MLWAKAGAAAGTIVKPTSIATLNMRIEILPSFPAER